MFLDKLNLGGRVAIVTGGGTGLGKATCLTLAQAGADIVVAARRRHLIEQTAEEIRELGGRALAIPTDATKRDQVQRMVEAALLEFGRIDVLVNNAGGARGIDVNPVELIRGQRLRKAWDWTDEEWHTSIDISLTTAFNCSQAVAPHMTQVRRGNIINFSSGAGMRAIQGNFAYCSAKAGVMGLTKALAGTWARYGIRVNCIVPGFVPGREYRSEWPEGELAKRGRFIPLGRLGEPEEVANVALFLASDASEYITGEVFICDGGIMAAGYAPTDYAPVITPWGEQRGTGG